MKMKGLAGQLYFYMNLAAIPEAGQTNLPISVPTQTARAAHWHYLRAAIRPLMCLTSQINMAGSKIGMM